jgi:very-short-patch-repair endonuclease
MTNPLIEFKKQELDVEILKLPQQSHVRRKYVKENIMKVELIRYCVENLEMSALSISKNVFKPKGYVVDAGTIIEFCKRNNIKSFSIKEVANHPKVREKYRKTCLERFGEENCLSRNTNGYKKRNKTVKEKYGVDNVFQLGSVIKKSKETMLEKYGVTSNTYLPTFERNYGRRSKIHKKIETILSKHNISYESEAKNKFFTYNEYLTKYYSPVVDILLEDFKLVIEINGDRWHANPTIYNPNDMIRRFRGWVSASEIWEFDDSRTKQIESFGYKVIVLWEYDINKNEDKINNILYEKIFKNQGN